MNKDWIVTCTDKSGNINYLQLLSRGKSDIILQYSEELWD